jgi:hypothetical protein
MRESCSSKASKGDGRREGDPLHPSSRAGRLLDPVLSGIITGTRRRRLGLAALPGRKLMTFRAPALDNTRWPATPTNDAKQLARACCSYAPTASPEPGGRLRHRTGRRPYKTRTAITRRRSWIDFGTIRSTGRSASRLKGIVASTRTAKGDGLAIGAYCDDVRGRRMRRCWRSAEKAAQRIPRGARHHHGGIRARPRKLRRQRRGTSSSDNASFGLGLVRLRGPERARFLAEGAGASL